MADKKSSKRLVRIAGNHENLTEKEVISLALEGIINRSVLNLNNIIVSKKLTAFVKDVRSLAGSVRAQYVPAAKKSKR